MSGPRSGARSGSRSGGTSGGRSWPSLLLVLLLLSLSSLLVYGIWLLATEARELYNLLLALLASAALALLCFRSLRRKFRLKAAHRKRLGA